MYSRVKINMDVDFYPIDFFDFSMAASKFTLIEKTVKRLLER